MQHGDGSCEGDGIVCLESGNQHIPQKQIFGFIFLEKRLIIEMDDRHDFLQTIKEQAPTNALEMAGFVVCKMIHPAPREQHPEETT